MGGLRSFEKGGRGFGFIESRLRDGRGFWSSLIELRVIEDRSRWQVEVES